MTPRDIVYILEIPYYIFNLLVMDRWGRKPILVSGFLLTGVTAVPAAFLEEGTLRTILGLAGIYSYKSTDFRGDTELRMKRAEQI